MQRSKNFVVLGTPRSGTTFFCKTLAQLPNVWLPPFLTYEPFSQVNVEQVSNAFRVPQFDTDAMVAKLLGLKQKRNVEYFGFKTFLSQQYDISKMLDTNGFAIFLVLRKDIWKVLCSGLVALVNKNYAGSSKRFAPFHFDGSNMVQRLVAHTFSELCRDYWWAENVGNKNPNLVETIYFEDLIRPQAVFNGVNEYFQQVLSFDADYKEDSIDQYIDNFNQLKVFVMEIVRKAPYNYATLPTYVKDHLT